MPGSLQMKQFGLYGDLSKNGPHKDHTIFQFKKNNVIAICNPQPATCDLRPATRNPQPATRNLQPAVYTLEDLKLH